MSELLSKMGDIHIPKAVATEVEAYDPTWARGTA
jgi:hypothetical protein